MLAARAQRQWAARLAGGLVFACMVGCAQMPGSAESDTQGIVGEHLAMLSNPASRGVVPIPILDDYLAVVLKRVTASADPKLIGGLGLRVYVSGIDDVGADAVSDGAIYIRWRSLVALDSEEELAALLSHEACHLLLGHLQEGGFSSLIKPITSLATVATAAAGAPAALLASVFGGQYVDKAGLASWSRSAELEADAAGFALLRKAGYDGSAYFDLFDVLDRPAQEPPGLSDNFKPTGRPNEYTVDIGNISLGQAERSHPAYGERRTQLKTLAAQSGTAPIAASRPIDDFKRVRSLPEVAAAIAGLEATTRAALAFRNRNEIEIQRQLAIAQRSPVGSSAVVQLEVLNYTGRRLSNAALPAHLEPFASQPQAPIIVSIMQITFAIVARDWTTATHVADRLQTHYLARPELYPLITKAYEHRAQQIAATLPKLGNIPVSGRGHEADFAEYQRLTKLRSQLGWKCIATGDLNLIAGCTQAAN